MEEQIEKITGHFPGGITDKELRGNFPDAPVSAFAEAINLLGSLEILKDDDGLIYKKKNGYSNVPTPQLDEDELVVFQTIKAAENNGIWTKDIKTKTGLHQTVLTKVLKTLENKKIIKSIKSIKYPTRKVFILACLEPSADLTGGPWFSENELDVEFIEHLYQLCHRFLFCSSIQGSDNCLVPRNHRRLLSLSEISEFVSSSGVINAEISVSDLHTILDRLVFDGLAHKIGSGIDRPGSLIFKARKEQKLMDYLSMIPCGHCPVEKSCCQKGPITPISCAYFKEWL